MYQRVNYIHKGSVIPRIQTASMRLTNTAAKHSDGKRKLQLLVSRLQTWDTSCFAPPASNDSPYPFFITWCPIYLAEPAFSLPDNVTKLQHSQPNLA